MQNLLVLIAIKLDLLNTNANVIQIQK